MMRSGAALLAVLLALPAPLAANSLTLQFSPSNDRRRDVYCTIQLHNDQFVVVEIVGTGFAMPTLRWPASEAEIAVLLSALGAFLANDPASVPDPIVSRLPEPPFVSVTWMADMTNGLQSGLYLQQGFDLPDVLDQVIDRFLRGGPCAEAVTG